MVILFIRDKKNMRVKKEDNGQFNIVPNYAREET